MLVYFRDRAVQTNCMCYHSAKDVADQTCYLIHLKNIQTLGQPVSALTLKHQAPGSFRWCSNYFLVTGMTQPEKSLTILLLLLIIIIIALKGAIRDFLQSHHCAANCLQHVCSRGAIVCKSRATCSVPLITMRQPNY